MLPIALAALAALAPTGAFQDPRVLPLELAELAAPDATADMGFGLALSLDGDLLVVGAPFQDTRGFSSGSAYLFARSGAHWSFVQELQPSTSGSGKFGYSVAIDGDRIAVGRPEFSQVVIFERDPESGLYDEVRVLQHCCQLATGGAVALQGDILVVGGPGSGAPINLGQPAGVLLIHDRNAGGPDAWGQVYELFGGSCSGLGSAVDIDGDRIVVGAPGGSPFASCDPFYGGPMPPAAHVIERDGETWRLDATFDPAQGTSFSADSVAISGDTLALERFGGAVLFRKQEGSWNEWTTIEKPSFTTEVAMDGDRLVIGGPRALLGAGVVWIHERHRGGANAWGELGRLVASGGLIGDNFGERLALSGPNLAAGARLDDLAAPNAGSVIVFRDFLRASALHRAAR